MALVAGLLCRLCRCVRTTRPREAEPTKAETRLGDNPSDDLASIRGIGIAAQNRLYAAGIKTYENLADAAPEDIRKVLGKLARGANAEDWIADARKRVRREKA